MHIKDVDAADQISVINIMGATQVMSAQNITAEGCTIDISTLPAGTYQLQIFGNKKFRNCVIVKMD